MRGGAEGAAAEPGASAASDRAAEIARLRREIGRLRAGASGPVPGPTAAIPPQGTRSGAV
jgi:hypothetical protein